MTSIFLGLVAIYEPEFLKLFAVAIDKRATIVTIEAMDEWWRRCFGKTPSMRV